MSQGAVAENKRQGYEFDSRPQILISLSAASALDLITVASIEES